MALEAVERTPHLADFTPLSEHEEQTPGSFFGGKPVLHLHAQASTVKVAQQDFEAHPDLKQLTGADTPHVATDSTLHILDIDVWVTSRHLILFSSSLSSGLQLSYQTITVTAQDGSDVLLELNLSHPDTADEDIDFLQLRILPTHIEQHHAQPNTSESSTNGTSSNNDAATALFAAISACQELNPDPAQEEEDEDLDQMTEPGANGWITSENMDQFLDEHGNLRMSAEGPVAGQTRTAAEMEDGEDGDEESKWQRTG